MKLPPGVAFTCCILSVAEVLPGGVCSSVAFTNGLISPNWAGSSMLCLGFAWSWGAWWARGSAKCCCWVQRGSSERSSHTHARCPMAFFPIHLLCSCPVSDLMGRAVLQELCWACRIAPFGAASAALLSCCQCTSLGEGFAACFACILPFPSFCAG